MRLMPSTDYGARRHVRRQECSPPRKDAPKCVTREKFLRRLAILAVPEDGERDARDLGTQAVAAPRKYVMPACVCRKSFPP